MLQGESPLYIADVLTTNKTVHGRETRHDQYNFVCTSPWRGRGGSFNVSSVKLRNGLPDEIKRKNILLSFKNALKTYFINFCIDIDYFEILL